MVKLSQLQSRDFIERSNVRVVRDNDCEGFEVTRNRMPGIPHLKIRAHYYYMVENYTHFKEPKTCLTLVEVRKIIQKA